MQKDTFAEVNGARLYYEIAGEGPPLVLVHAGLADGRMWDEQFQEFAKHYRVLRYDRRRALAQHGKTRGIQSACSFVLGLVKDR